jgi:predicted ester cyclase
MTLDHNKSLSRRSLEMWRSHATDEAETVFAASYANHQEPSVEGGTKSLDLDGWRRRRLVDQVRRAFPDLEVRIETQIAEGDLVATRWRFAGTQSGEYLGHAPPGRRAIWTGVQIDRFANGRIVESWVDWDKYRFFDELGLLG